MLCPRLNVTRYARSRGSELRSLLTLRWRRQSGANSSLLKIPCLQGKEQGIFAESQFSRALERQNRQLHQSLTAQFPTHPNREFFAAQTYQSLRAPLAGVQARLNGRAWALALAGEARSWPMEFSTLGRDWLRAGLPFLARAMSGTKRGRACCGQWFGREC